MADTEASLRAHVPLSLSSATTPVVAAESAANQPERDAPELQTAPLESLVMHAMLTSPARDPEAALAATPDPPSREAVRAATRTSA